MGSGCTKTKSTYEDFETKYAPKKRENSVKHTDDFIGLKRELSKNSNPEDVNNVEHQPQKVVKRVRHGIDWKDLEKGVQAMNLQLLREDLNENPERFLINQILLSTQFFKNFER